MLVTAEMAAELAASAFQYDQHNLARTGLTAAAVIELVRLDWPMLQYHYLRGMQWHCSIRIEFFCRHL